MLIVYVTNKVEDQINKGKNIKIKTKINKTECITIIEQVHAIKVKATNKTGSIRLTKL